ncbi:PEP-CTERM sorting domain-containing protein [Glaciimonas immobilis]|nr:PEP-CTERM sorting domain-containing protein [Glaciimonas immobilis]
MAKSVSLSDFDTSATTIQTSSFAAGATTLVSPEVTISNGTNYLGRWTGTQLSYLDTNTGGLLVKFSSPVGMFGAEFVANHVPATLSVYSASNILIDSITLGPTGLKTINGFPTGFLGLAETSKKIDHAVFSTTMARNSIYIGPIVYQEVSSTVSPVPEPETYAMLMGGLALIGCMVSRRKSS